MIYWISLLLGVITLIYFKAVKPYSFWSKRNVKTSRIIPIVGENLGLMMGTESFAQSVPRIYNIFPDVRYFGIFQFQAPVLVVRCPELLKQICVKDFEYFLNRRTFVPDKIESLMSKNLLALKDRAWKDMRSALSPSFTSSKMRAIFVLMRQNAQNFAQYFLDKNEELVEVEFLDVCMRYANDVIFNSVYGIDVDSLKDRGNDFFAMGNDASNFNTLHKKLVFTLYQMMPSVASFFNVSLFGGQVEDFFEKIVKESIEMREKNNIKRPDMLGLLLDAKKDKFNRKSAEEMNDLNLAEDNVEEKSTKKDLDYKDVAAQLFIFFLAGFETVSRSMCFMAYELAVNPDIQKRLIEEIDSCKTEGGIVSYETLINLPYLDMVVSETLRMWPLAIASDRQVTKPYTIEPELPGETPLHLERNQIILIPLFGLHRDPKYYENPEKFDPERFSPENKHNINPYTYLPFGVGPRNCIGSRFSLLEVKAMFYYLLKHFEIVPVEKTNIPIKISKTALNLTSDDGFPFGLKRRH